MYAATHIGEPWMKPLAIVTGVGPGTGAAMARRFSSGGYRVAMLARDADRLTALERELPDSIAVPCDVSDASTLIASLDELIARFGAPNVVVHNAVGGAFGNFLDVAPEVLERNFQVNVMALLHLARRLAPAMVEAGGGSLIVTGNTSALRGKANFAGFAPTKAAQRILAESIAREMGPQGLHVAYLLIDAVIDVPWTRARYKEVKDDFFIKPASIAEEAWHIAHQDRSAWSFLVEVRPFGENW
jgi:short-subunit dehydrogenase